MDECKERVVSYPVPKEEDLSPETYELFEASWNATADNISEGAASSLPAKTAENYESNGIEEEGSGFGEGGVLPPAFAKTNEAEKTKKAVQTGDLSLERELLPPTSKDSRWYTLESVREHLQQLTAYVSHYVDAAGLPNLSQQFFGKHLADNSLSKQCLYVFTLLIAVIRKCIAMLHHADSILIHPVYAACIKSREMIQQMIKKVCLSLRNATKVETAGKALSKFVKRYVMYLGGLTALLSVLCIILKSIGLKRLMELSKRLISKIRHDNGTTELNLSDSLKRILDGEIIGVRFLDSSKFLLKTVKQDILTTKLIPGSQGAVFEAIASKVPDFGYAESRRWDSLLLFSVPFSIGIFFWWKLYRHLLADSNSTEIGTRTSKDKRTTFDDVVSPAVDQLKDIVTYLVNPSSLEEAGARLPRGVVLSGHAGTGKTLLAKAVAGEACVPFIACSASEFVDIYVGNGAHHIRALFEKARKRAPCVVFIDELDALVNREKSSVSGGGSEYIQTVNQLLTELDGFYGKADGIVVMAATNRVSSLDPALIRSGRFDRLIYLELPTLEERVKILKLYQRKRKMKIENTELLEEIAKKAHGFAGADLENLLNESILEALRNGSNVVKENHLESACSRIQEKLRPKETYPAVTADSSWWNRGSPFPYGDMRKHKEKSTVA